MQTEINFIDYFSGKSPEILRAIKFVAGLDRLLVSKEVIHEEFARFLLFRGLSRQAYSLILSRFIELKVELQSFY